MHGHIKVDVYDFNNFLNAFYIRQNINLSWFFMVEHGAVIPKHSLDSREEQDVHLPYMVVGLFLKILAVSVVKCKLKLVLYTLHVLATIFDIYRFKLRLFHFFLSSKPFEVLRDHRFLLQKVLPWWYSFVVD